MRFLMIAKFLGPLCILPIATMGAVPVASASQPKGVKPRGDAFDRLSSLFPIQDWISFAKDEYNRLERIKGRSHPRFFFVVSNDDGDKDEAAWDAGSLPMWMISGETIPARSFVFVADPIAEEIRSDMREPDLVEILVFDRISTRSTDTIILGQNK